MLPATYSGSNMILICGFQSSLSSQILPDFDSGMEIVWWWMFYHAFAHTNYSLEFDVYTRIPINIIRVWCFECIEAAEDIYWRNYFEDEWGNDAVRHCRCWDGKENDSRWTQLPGTFFVIPLSLFPGRKVGLPNEWQRVRDYVHNDDIGKVRCHL